jgi:hypothetical protein
LADVDETLGASPIAIGNPNQRRQQSADRGMELTDLLHQSDAWPSVLSCPLHRLEIGLNRCASS